ncbi:phage protease [Halocynthiibacter styelae]|uniref:Uncharacterized protein n=1 Tax=Halocynthiibacter styelae TaxID=2761955 RepID=A0A8J7J147_9RHOB|nr:phage protease [Paenihalocynthiibacter styelae]MBI1495394.1 hypothetical protein [Paenihalocynthiibacter styelae]
MNNDLSNTDFQTVLASGNAGSDARHYLATALAFELKAEKGTSVAPDWVQIFPAGPELATVDGRNFRMSDPEAFVERQMASEGMPILVDFDHLSSFKPEENGDQTAAGWIEELEVRDGAVWARVAWTVRASEQIAGKEWRFVSPEFRVHKTTREVVTLDALALVNRPAFQMKALARADIPKTEDAEMLKEIAKALGLSEDATQEQVLTAIRNKDQELETAKAAKIPSTDDFMPRADYDAVLARANSAEAELEETAKAGRKAEIDELISGAVKAGKITPATKDHYVALASASDAGFEEIKKLVEGMSQIAEPSNLNEGDVAAGALSDEDKEMAASLGIDEADYAKQLAADRGAADD